MVPSGIWTQTFLCERDVVSGHSRLLLNDGSGDFTEASGTAFTSNLLGYGHRSIFAADVDNDGGAHTTDSLASQ